MLNQIPSHKSQLRRPKDRGLPASLGFNGVWVAAVKSGVFPRGCLKCDRAVVTERRCLVSSRSDDSENWSLFPIVKI